MYMLHLYLEHSRTIHCTCSCYETVYAIVNLVCFAKRSLLFNKMPLHFRPVGNYYVNYTRML